MAIDLETCVKDMYMSNLSMQFKSNYTDVAIRGVVNYIPSKCPRCLAIGFVPGHSNGKEKNMLSEKR